MPAIVTCVLFDLGGVLIDFAGFERLPELLAESLCTEDVRGRWIASRSVAAFERGELSAEEFGASFAVEWDLRVSPDEFLERFVSWARDFYPGARELVAEVGRGVTTACFSNSNPLHWEKNFRMFGIQDAFDHCFASFELGAVKPERQAFDLLLEKLGCAPQEVLFIDDTDVNVAGARATGMQAERARGVAEARQVLASRGLASPAAD